MTKLGSTLIMGAAIALGTAGGAGAADLYGGGLKDGHFVSAAPVTQHRWYARIDGSYSGYDRPDSVLNLHGLQVEGTNAEIETNWSLGGGIGVYFSPNVRGDITYDRRFETDFSGRFVFDPGFGYGPTSFQARAPIESDLLLANVYYDFDCRCRFTPYVGIGLGAVRHTVGRGTFTSDNGTFNGSTASQEDWHVAGALMAGFSVALRHNIHFDAGYRFLYLGDASTGQVNIPVPAGGTVNGQDPTIDTIHAHELRVGLRYDLR